MLSDFSFITHKFPERQDIKIYPVADVHLGAAEHKGREWNDFCATVLKDENAYITLGGDLIDNGTRSSVGNGIFENTMRPREAKKLMVEMLDPLRSRILCAIPGNHERRSTKDADDEPMYDIMCKLDLEELYRENIGFVRLRFGDNKKGHGSDNPTYVVCVTHGAGGGMLIGSAVNRASRFAQSIDGIDALIVGHTHKPFDVPDCKIKVDQNTISIRPFPIVSVSSWLNYGGYPVQKLYSATASVPQIMMFRGRKKQIDVTTTY